MKLLAVDDDEVFLILMERSFRGTDISVMTASSPEQALECIDANPDINVLATDIKLNGIMSGYELAQQAVERIADISIIYLSGLRSDHDRRMVVPGQVLLKPVESDEIRDAVLGIGASST